MTYKKKSIKPILSPRHILSDVNDDSSPAADKLWSPIVARSKHDSLRDKFLSRSMCFKCRLVIRNCLLHLWSWNIHQSSLDGFSSTNSRENSFPLETCGFVVFHRRCSTLFHVSLPPTCHPDRWLFNSLIGPVIGSSRQEMTSSMRTSNIC